MLSYSSEKSLTTINKVLKYYKLYNVQFGYHFSVIKQMKRTNVVH